MHREPTQNPTQMHTIVETIFYGARIQIKKLKMVHHNQKSSSTIKTKPTNAPIIILPHPNHHHLILILVIYRSPIVYAIVSTPYNAPTLSRISTQPIMNATSVTSMRIEKKTAGEGMYVNQAYEMSDFRSYPAICYPISFHSHTSTPPSLHFVMCQNQDLWGVYTHMNVMWCDARMVSVYVYIHRVIKCCMDPISSLWRVGMTMERHFIHLNCATASLHFVKWQNQDLWG